MNTNIDKNTRSIKFPYLSKIKKKILFAGVILVLSLILLTVFVTSKKGQKGQMIEKDNITLFLENVMIREDGLFTLLGSKPMTLFDITETLFETEEDLKIEYEQSKVFLEKCKQDPEHYHSDVMNLPEYNEFKEKCLKLKHAMRFLQHKNLWENWLNEKKIISSNIYKLTSREDFGLFINIPNALYILKKHYVDFSEKTGVQFDINTVLDSIEDNHSPFWNKVFKNHYLFGLIMGYGQKNSFLFEWAVQHHFSMKSISLCRFKELSRLYQHVDVMRKIDIDVHDLEVPYFATFEIDNEDVVRYSREREKIIDFLKDKELVPFTLAQLKNPD